MSGFLKPAAWAKDVAAREDKTVAANMYCAFLKKLCLMVVVNGCLIMRVLIEAL